MSRAVAATPMRKPFMTALGRVRRPAPPEAPSPPRAAASPGAPSPPSARPTASIVSPTATMCAWYQVVVFCAAYQKAVPKAKTTVVPARTTIETPSRPIIHQHSATSTAAKIGEDQLVIRLETEGGHERDHRRGPAAAGRGSGRARCRPLVRWAGRPGRGSCQIVLPCSVLDSGCRPDPRGTRRPATRSGRSSAGRR